MCTVLNYTGLCTDEGLSELICEPIELDRAFAYIGEHQDG
jgi:hypothetical protein